MTENQKKILEMVADKKITVDEAYRLLSLIQSSAESGKLIFVTSLLRR